MQLAKEIQYVCGIAFLKRGPENLGGPKMLLVRKNKGPKAVKDKLCPIGGKVEVTRESHRGGMIREFREECGIETTIDEWMTFHVERYGPSDERNGMDSRVTYMVARLPADRFNSYRTAEDEPIEVHGFQDVIDGCSEYVHNLDHLMIMALNYLMFPEHRYLEG